jgi:hypothetical protein
MLVLGAGRFGGLEPPVGVPARKIVSTWFSNVDSAKWRRLILDHPGGISLARAIGTTLRMRSRNVLADLRPALMRGG